MNWLQLQRTQSQTQGIKTFSYKQWVPGRGFDQNDKEKQQSLNQHIVQAPNLYLQDKQEYSLNIIL